MEGNVNTVYIVSTKFLNGTTQLTGVLDKMKERKMVLQGNYHIKTFVFLF